MQRELIYCGVFLLLPFEPSAGQNATQGGAGYSVDFTTVTISQKYVRGFRPGRPLMPTLFPKLDPRMSLDTIRT
jgi:hypothetical protein